MTKNFSFMELISSDVAKACNIENYPSSEHIVNLKRLCENVLQPARDLLGESIKVNSGYRCAKLNLKIKGAKNSQHMEGKAADITCSDNKKLFELIKDNLRFDQLIDEYNYKWIHVSWNGEKNRNQILHIK